MESERIISLLKAQKVHDYETCPKCSNLHLEQQH